MLAGAVGSKGKGKIPQGLIARQPVPHGVIADAEVILRKRVETLLKRFKRLGSLEGAFFLLLKLIISEAKRDLLQPVF